MGIEAEPRIRYEHRILASGEHCVTSPDVKGLCAVAGSEHEAREEAQKIHDLFIERGFEIVPRGMSTNGPATPKG